MRRRITVRLYLLRQDDETPLHCAAARNNIECLQMLVARGADVNVIDKVQTSLIVSYFFVLLLLGIILCGCQKRIRTDLLCHVKLYKLNDGCTFVVYNLNRLCSVGKCLKFYIIL